MIKKNGTFINNEQDYITLNKNGLKLKFINAFKFMASTIDY